MAKKTWLISAAVVGLVSVDLLAAEEGYWLIKEVRGRWEYRVGDEAPRVLTGSYDPISPRGEVRCLEARLEDCELRYLAGPRSSSTRPLGLPKVQPGRWVSLKRLPAPPAAFLPVTSSELADRYGRVTRAGGSRAASGCGGDFPLEAPTCGEVIDIDDLHIRWPAAPAGQFVVLVERADGDPTLFRGSADAGAGEFTDETLAAFLRKLQNPTAPVDVTIRVLADGGRSAVRLVRIPSAATFDVFTARIKQIGPGRQAPAIVTRMMLAMEEGMWSRAAEEATRLIDVAGRSAALLDYAAAGLCLSAFESAKGRLLKVLPAARYNAQCDPSRATPGLSTGGFPSSAETAPGSSGSPSSATDVEPAASLTRTRPGIALLIGNSDYWDMPLNSVKADIEGMSTTLASLGFAVHVKENLRNPRQFVEAIEDVLRRESAGSDDVLLVYYSGHGLQLDGKAHLLSTGVSARARVAEDLRDNAQSAEDLLALMERAMPASRILIVEACRDNVLSVPAGETPSTRGGFAFQQDDVPNTFVMFANRPGYAAAARSDYGLMGPFTEALVHALQQPAADILDVFNLAARKAVEISPGQQPVLYRSKSVMPLVFSVPDERRRNDRARLLVQGAEAAYHARAWEQLHATVLRAKALASDPSVVDRLTRELEFADLVVTAESAETRREWELASATWQRAHELFAPREWVGMRGAVAALLADDVSRAVQLLAPLAAQSSSELASRAKAMLDELTRAFPNLAEEARRASESARPVSGPEFEPLKDEE